MSGHTGTEQEHDQHNPTSQDPKTGIAGAASVAAGKTVSFMTAKLPSKTSRIAAVAAAGTLVLAGAGSAYAVHANDVSTHNRQVAAAQFAAEQKAASDKAAADAAEQERATVQQAATDKASADKASADKAAADKAAADAAAKAAADKAAADKAAAARAAAAAAANRDSQRQPLPTATATAPPTQAPTSTPTAKPKPTTTSPTSPSKPKATTPTGSYGSAYDIAESMVPAGQFACFSNIVERESGWNVHATNPSSGAYGLGQALPGNKMASAGSDWENNPATQIKWVLSYMDSRYGSPCGAWSFWQSHNWY